MATKKDFRLKLVDTLGNTSYIARRGDRVSYVSGSETPLALSNAAGNNAAALRFELEDAFDAAEALKATKKVVYESYTVTIY